VAHEKSITVRNRAGKFVNLDTVHGGKHVPKAAVEWLRSGHLKALGGKEYDTPDKAVDAAKKRSSSFNKSLLTGKRVKRKKGK
jgi:hypothetical protein